MVPEHDVDPAELYDAERRRLLASVGALTDEQLATIVPATPSWTVHDVVSHLVGIAADLNAQRFGDGDGDRWTRAQIDARRTASVADLAAEWEREAALFVDGLRLFGYDFGAHYLGDLLQHAGDVQHALGRSPSRDDLAVAVGLDFYLASFEETLDEAGVGAVEVRTLDGEQWVLGPGPVAASVRAARWELFRSLGGRRTRAEIVGLDWDGDRAAVVDLVSRYPVPQVSLRERG